MDLTAFLIALAPSVIAGAICFALGHERGLQMALETVDNMPPVAIEPSALADWALDTDGDSGTMERARR